MPQADQTDCNRQVLLNIYVNARQAMPTGGELIIQTDNVALDKDFVKAYRIKLGKYVRVSITDTGIGMKKVTFEISEYGGTQ